MKFILGITGLLALAAAPAMAQKTHVTAFVRDSNGAVYVNCSWSTTFVGQNTTPGAGPYAPDAYIQPQQGHCDSAGNFSVDLGDNVNTITPTPSQWQFNICSAPGYVPGGTFCSSAILITIQGASQDISSVVVPILPLLPVTGGATHFQVNSTPLVGTPTTINFVASTNMTIVDSGAGSITFSASGGGGGGSPGGTNQQNQFNNSSSFGGEFNSTFNTTTGETNTANFNKIRSPSPLVGTTYNWLQSPAADLSAPGAGKTITLTCGDGGTGHSNPCIGIDTSANANKPFSVYISTVGTPEAALVTGGTCSLFATANCTIIVTTANIHTAGYTVQSAYSGIQEASNDAGLSTPDAKILLQPVGSNANAYVVYAPIFLQNLRSVVEAGGSFVKCNTRSMCFVIGDLVNVNDFLDIRIHGLRFASGTLIPGVGISNTERAGCPGAGTCQINITTSVAHPFVVGDYVDIQMTNNTVYWGIWKITTVPDNTHFSALYTSQINGLSANTNIVSAASIGNVALANAGIFDNAESSVFSEIQFEAGAAGPGTAGKFHNGIVVFNDQAAVIDSPDVSSGSAFRCDSTYCSSAIYGPGPFSVNSAVIYVRGRQLAMGCGGNGITNFAGNTLGVSDIVIEGFNQWAINDSNRGGFGFLTGSNVYNEVGNCTNPQYSGTVNAAHGAMGVMGGGTVRGGEFPTGASPIYDCTGAAGASALYYWIIIRDSILGSSTPLFAGNTTSTCSGNVTVQWPRVQGTNTVTYDILRTPQGGAPSIGGCGGGSITSCGSVVTAQAQCNTQICSFTDNSAANTTSYAVVNPNYFPQLYFWPGAAILSTGGDTQQVSSVPRMYLDSTNALTGQSQLISESGWLVPNFFAQECSQVTNGTWVSCLAENSAGNNSLGATVLQGGIANGGTTSNLKGRLSFNWSTSVPAGELITLVDSCPSCTWAAGNKRPAAVTTDAYIGSEGGSPTTGAPIAFGSAVSITDYINSLPDNLNWKTRLTATKWENKADTQLDGNATLIGNPNGFSPFLRSGSQATDTCVRADGALGANWTVTDGTWAISSNTCMATAIGGDSYALAAYTALSFANDQYAQATLTAITGNVGVCVRMSSVAVTAYCFVTNSGSTSLLVKKVAGVATSLGTNTQLAVGDVIGISAQGTTITAYRNGAALFTATDSAIASGSPGMAVTATTTNKLVSWRGGDFSWASTPAISVVNATCTGTCTGFAGGGTVTHTGNLTATAIMTGNGVADSQTPSATSTLSAGGDISTQGSYISTAANGGIFGTEGTGNCTPGAGTDCMYWDSTLHGVHLNTNNVDQGVAIGTRSFSAVYNHSGTQITTPHLIEDRCTLGTDCSVTLTGSAVYTSSSTYDCFGSDRTGANAIKFVPSSGSAFALTGTGTDLISYWCIGN